MTEVGPDGQGRPTYIPNKHETLTQRWFTVGPPSLRRWPNSKPTLGQRLLDRLGYIYRVQFLGHCMIYGHSCF